MRYALDIKTWFENCSILLPSVYQYLRILAQGSEFEKVLDWVSSRHLFFPQVIFIYICLAAFFFACWCWSSVDVPAFAENGI